MKIKDRIAKLIDLKSIATLIITIVFSYGFIVDKIEAKDFMLVVVMVYTFYFNKKKGEDEVEISGKYN